MSVQAVYDLLGADPGVVALVAGRIYPMALPPINPTQPNANLPAITLQRISTVRVRSQDGPAGLARPRVQINSWAATYAEAGAIAEAVRALLDGYRDDDGPVQGAFVAEDRDIYDSDLKLHGRSADYLVWHEEG